MSLYDYLTQVNLGLNRLKGDLDKMIVNLERKKEDPNAEEYTLTSIQRVTNLRKDVKEVQEANEHPQATFVHDRLGRIFEGIGE